MDCKTLAALKGSIAKWEAIIAGTDADMGSRNCPLCKVFFYRSTPCLGCPVYRETGEPYCEGSPYDRWIRLTDDEAENESGCLRRAETKSQKAAARAELRFLKSLLPKEPPR